MPTTYFNSFGRECLEDQNASINTAITNIKNAPKIMLKTLLADLFTDSNLLNFPSIINLTANTNPAAADNTVAVSSNAPWVLTNEKKVWL